MNRPAFGHDQRELRLNAVDQLLFISITRRRGRDGDARFAGTQGFVAASARIGESIMSMHDAGPDGGQHAK
jgi:hypothetical protein